MIVHRGRIKEDPRHPLGHVCDSLPGLLSHRLFESCSLWGSDGNGGGPEKNHPPSPQRSSASVFQVRLCRKADSHGWVSPRRNWWRQKGTRPICFVVVVCAFLSSWLVLLDCQKYIQECIFLLTAIFAESVATKDTFKKNGGFLKLTQSIVGLIAPWEGLLAPIFGMLVDGTFDVESRYCVFEKSRLLFAVSSLIFLVYLFFVFFFFFPFYFKGTRFSMSTSCSWSFVCTLNWPQSCNWRYWIRSRSFSRPTSTRCTFASSLTLSTSVNSSLGPHLPLTSRKSLPFWKFWAVIPSMVLSFDYDDFYFLFYFCSGSYSYSYS